MSVVIVGVLVVFGLMGLMWFVESIWITVRASRPVVASPLLEGAIPTAPTAVRVVGARLPGPADSGEVSAIGPLPMDRDSSSSTFRLHCEPRELKRIVLRYAKQEMQRHGKVYDPEHEDAQAALLAAYHFLSTDILRAIEQLRSEKANEVVQACQTVWAHELTSVRPVLDDIRHRWQTSPNVVKEIANTEAKLAQAAREMRPA